MKLKNKTRESIAYIAVFMSILLPIVLSVQNWLNSEDVIVLANTAPLPSPTIGQIDDELPEAEPVLENETYKDLIYEYFGEDGAVAYAIAKAESTLHPDKCHIDEKEYSCGLFQINLRAHFNKVPGETYEEKAEFLKIPKNNVLIAKFLHGSSGFYPWSVFTNKTYLKFLSNEK